MIDLIETEDQIIAVDIVGNFSVLDNAELTDYPVEDGSTRSDHKIIGPKIVEVEIKQTEYPIDDPEYSFTDLSFSYETPTAKPFSPKYEVREVQTRVISPFLLVGGAIRGAVGAAVGAILGKNKNVFTGLTTGSPKKKTGAMQTYQTSTPRDRGGELADLLEALYYDEDATCSVTYRGRTYTDLSLIGLTLSYEQAGLSGFNCSFKQLRTASVSTADLFDPAELAHKAKESKGKGKDKPTAPAGKPKSVAKALFG